jgi:DNA-binding beta-propeller fold protein YncE
MRRILVLLLFLAVALAACADTPAPTEPVAATPPPSSTSAPAPTPTSATRYTATPPPPPPDDAPWPTFLRELNFGIPAGNSYGPRALAIHPGLSRIYVRTQSQNTDAPGQVTVLDSTTGRVLARVETGLDSYADGAIAVDTIRDRAYAINADEATASVFDANTLEPVATIQGAYGLALDADGGRLYLGGLDGLRVLGVADYGILQKTEVSYSPRFLDIAVAPARNRVYVTYEDMGDYLLGQYEASTLQELATIHLPGMPEDLAPDPGRDRVYVSLTDGERNLLWTLDDDGRLLDERILGDWTHTTRLALDPEGDRLFLGRAVDRDHGISVLDLQSGEMTADIPLDLAPNGLAWDPDNGRLLVSHTYHHKIGVVGLEADEPAFLFPTALNLVDLAVDPGRGHVYVTDTAGRLHVLDSESDQELIALPGRGRIAVDGPHGRLYTGGEGAGRVIVFDADSLQQTGEIHTRARPVADAHFGQLYLVQNGIYLTSLETMTVTAAISDTLPESPGYSPNPSAVDAVVDPGSGRVFAIISNGVPGSNAGTYLYVYEPETYQRVLTDTERSPAYVDVDPTTGRAYVSRIHMDGRSTSLLEDGREYSARLDAVFGALRVDPVLNYVYLSVSGDEEGDLLVLDAGNLEILGSVPIPGDFSLRALDPQRHLLYLATEDGRVQIWAAPGSGNTPPARTVSARPPAER